MRATGSSCHHHRFLGSAAAPYAVLYKASTCLYHHRFLTYALWVFRASPFSCIFCISGLLHIHTATSPFSACLHSRPPAVPLCQPPGIPFLLHLCILCLPAWNISSVHHGGGWGVSGLPVIMLDSHFTSLPHFILGISYLPAFCSFFFSLSLSPGHLYYSLGFHSLHFLSAYLSYWYHLKHGWVLQMLLCKVCHSAATKNIPCLLPSACLLCSLLLHLGFFSACTCAYGTATWAVCC